MSAIAAHSGSSPRREARWTSAAGDDLQKRAGRPDQGGLQPEANQRLLVLGLLSERRQSGEMNAFLAGPFPESLAIRLPIQTRWRREGPAGRKVEQPIPAGFVVVDCPLDHRAEGCIGSSGDVGCPVRWIGSSGICLRRVHRSGAPPMGRFELEVDRIPDQALDQRDLGTFARNRPRGAQKLCRHHERRPVPAPRRRSNRRRFRKTSRC